MNPMNELKRIADALQVRDARLILWSPQPRDRAWYARIDKKHSQVSAVKHQQLEKVLENVVAELIVDTAWHDYWPYRLEHEGERFQWWEGERNISDVFRLELPECLMGEPFFEEVVRAELQSAIAPQSHGGKFAYAAAIVASGTCGPGLVEVVAEVRELNLKR